MSNITKIGRNDSCPCGSGKKYKQCCLKEKTSNPPEDVLWHRLRQVLDGLPIDLLKFSQSYYGPAGIHEAWDEFTGWQEIPFESDTPHMPVFMPWFFHDWLPDIDTEVFSGADDIDVVTLAQAYVQKKGKRLDPLLVRYIEQCALSAFCFFDVVSCQPGYGMVLRDIFTGEVINVSERSASQHAKPNDILFGKVVQIDHVALLEACAPVLIPPFNKAPVLALCKQLQTSGRELIAEELRFYDLEMFEIYHGIVDQLLNPALPELQNTDGDTFLPHKIYYDINSPRETFDALSHLCIMASADELLADATFNSDGVLCKIEFAWQKKGNKLHQSWDNTIMGHIEINDRIMIAEVNSERRAKQFNTMMKKLLGDKARYKTSVIQSPYPAMEQVKQNKLSAADKKQQQESDDFSKQPELQQHLVDHMRAYYQSWPDTKIPLLNNKTPKQAVKTADGKEMVEALLAQIERGPINIDPQSHSAMLMELRTTLGIKKEG